MKSYLRIICLVLLAACAASLTAKAQKGDPQWSHQIEVTAGAGIPGGDAGQGMKTGFGASATYYYRAMRALFISVGASYLSFDTFTEVPVLVGLKYNLATKGVQPYLGLEAGLYLASNTVGGVSSSETDYGIAPKVGVRVPLSDGLDLDLNLKYHVVMGLAKNPDGTTPSFNIIGLNLGLSYTLDYLKTH